MATIRQRGKGWEAQVRKQGSKSVTKTFLNKQDAEKWARRVETELERGIYLDPTEAQTTSVRDILDRYSQEVVPHKKGRVKELSKIKTLSRYLGHLPLSALKSSVVAQYRDARLKLVSGLTVRRELSVLQHALNLVEKDWGIHLPHGNPVTQVRLPKLPQGRDRRLKEGEEAQLLAALSQNPTMQAVVSFALETAMRRGEIVAMCWEHVDLRHRVLLIPETKTDVSRTIPLSTRAVEILKQLPRRIDGLVFGLKADSITQAFDRACERAGIQDLRFHDLRHEATSRFFEIGLNPMEVSAITGHKTLQMLSRYTHLKATELAKKLA